MLLFGHAQHDKIWTSRTHKANASKSNLTVLFSDQPKGFNLLEGKWSKSLEIKDLGSTEGKAIKIKIKKIPKNDAAHQLQTIWGL